MKVPRDGRDQARMALWIWLAALGGSFALAPLTESRAYIIVGVISAGLVTLIGFGLRMLRMPWPVTLLAEVVALFWWAMLTYASETTAFAIVPTPDTFHEFDRILTVALDHAQQYAAPVPDNPSLHALLAISVGLIAIFVDLLAGSLQQAPAVGLVFLAVYMAPVALLSGHVSLWFFVPGALAYVFLIAAEERSTIARWGRNISYADSTALSDSRGIYSSGLASAGRRVGFGAVALAVVVPIVVPTFSTNFFGSGGIDGGGSGDGGSGDVRVGDPMADMRRNLTGQSTAELLRMSGTTKPSYVRLAALDELSDAGWQASERGPKTTPATSGVLPVDPGVDATVPVSTATYDVKVNKAFDSTWLPTIYQPVSLADVDGDGDWLSDSVNLDVVAGNGDTNASGMQYTLNVRYTTPSRRQVLTAGKNVPADLKRMLELPESTPNIVKARAEEVAGDEDSQFDQAQAIQDWFRSSGGFTYSTAQASGSGMETIENFLTDDRVGYCEQYASAMAMMARELGIPARVTVGFLDGEPSGDDTYVFRGTDMHAWPELYLDGIGWTAFEPTPGQRTGPAPDFFNSGGNEAETSITPGQNDQSRTPTDDDTSSANLDKADAAAGGGGGDDDSGFPWAGAGIGVLVIALLAGLCFVPRALRSMVRRRRWDAATDPARAAESAWDELRDTVRDLRLPWPAGATPRATGRRLRPMVETRQHAVDGLNRLVLAVERSRYAEHSESLDLRDDVEAIAAALSSRVSRRTRRKALWLPVSLLGEFGVSRRRSSSADDPQRPAQPGLLALEE